MTQRNLSPACPLAALMERKISMGLTHIYLNRFGVAATFITTLTFMLSESDANGAPDNEQTRGMITSLW